MRNKLFNKILPKTKYFGFNNKSFQSISNENRKLKNCISKLSFENSKHKDENRILEKQNKRLFEQNIHLKEENKKLNKLNDFINFQEFLANSYVSPIINAPFHMEDKRVFAFMDHITKYLMNNVAQSKDKPLVSIILPTYNREGVIQKAIDSVLKQTYGNWELIVIDDGSTDNTLNLLDEIGNNKIKIISYNENKGHAFARNIGLENALGKYIMYLDSDNEWDDRYIETMVGAFIELPDADALYSGQLLYKNYDSNPFAIRFGSFNKSLLHNRNYIDMNCFCHKNHIYKEIGGFNENLIKLVDWEYILRIGNKFKIYSVPVLLSKYYESDSLNRVTNLPFDYYKNSSDILKKNKLCPKEYKNLSHNVSIIIPSYESLNELKECVETILSFDLENMVEIIIIDNNSSIEVKDYLNRLKSKNIKIILNNTNYGFTYAVQQGIELSDDTSDILLLNNDAILTKGAIEHMQTGAYSYENCGLIVPHEVVFENNSHMNFHVPYADKKFKCDVTPSKVHHNIINMPIFHDGGLLELNFAPFFCVYIKREVYNKTLGLDPELGRHYRSDRIFSDVIRHILKMKIYQEPNAYVFHKHQTATRILKKNEKEFDIIFRKNQWPADLAKELGYRKSLWD